VHLRWYLAATFGPLEAAESVAGGKGSQHWLDEQFQRRKRPEGAGARSLEKLGLVLCQLADDAMRKTRNGPSTSCLYVSLPRWNGRLCEGR
jgi:hypothetical protein